MKSRIFVKSHHPKIDPSTREVQIPVSPERIEYYKTKKTTTIFAMLPLADTYLEVLEELQATLLSSKEKTPKSSSLIPFVVTAAATLECLLNDKMIMYANYMVGLGSGNSLAKSFLSMSLPGKLNTIILLLSRNQFTVRQDNSVYRQLRRLIRLRNSLMHGKSFVDRQDVKVDHKADGYSYTVKVPELPYRNIKIDDCAGFLRALQEFSRLLDILTEWGNEKEIPVELQSILRALPPR